ncbi:MAG: hypothetical protein D4R44_06240 [Actinobacteria bacterium]|nr:MAG: hypothetical protein D4R44_06240 [Actinomycetota bacterium]
MSSAFVIAYLAFSVSEYRFVIYLTRYEDKLQASNAFRVVRKKFAVSFVIDAKFIQAHQFFFRISCCAAALATKLRKSGLRLDQI